LKRRKTFYSIAFNSKNYKLQNGQQWQSDSMQLTEYHQSDTQLLKTVHYFQQRNQHSLPGEGKIFSTND
jgi:hypothetical protein